MPLPLNDLVPRLAAPRLLALRSTEGLREPLNAVLPPVRLRFDAAARFELPRDEDGYEALRSLACMEPARFDTPAEVLRPRAWSRVTRLDPEAAPCWRAVSALR
jgi:hypothetical protein